METIPLFPLHTVLFPGGPLALRIFEPRYLDMISRCLKSETGFGVVLIRDGSEVGGGATTYSVGTYGRISYWSKRSDGLLGITLRGEQRFRIESTTTQADGLLLGEVTRLDNEPPTPIPDEYAGLVSTLEEIFEQLDHPYTNLPRAFDDASWVGGRLTELLPLGNRHKQRALQMDEPLERLALVESLLNQKPLL